MSLGLTYSGSFQDLGRRFESENPLTEVWSRIEQLASTGFLHRLFEKQNLTDADAELFRYASLRLRQCVEFRRAARNATILTAPMLFYYSFLNLTRGFLALYNRNIPAEKAHGLKLIETPVLLDSEAQLTKGSFSALLDAMGFTYRDREKINLSEVLACIVELREAVPFLKTIIGQQYRVVRVEVTAVINGPITLTFSSALKDFDTSWEKDFPELVEDCILRPGENTLQLRRERWGEEYLDVCNWCAQNLMPDLLVGDSPSWFLIRRIENQPILPRAAYYLAGMFILGSLVRYHPESLVEATEPDSDLSWLLRRFVDCAERFFPQLMLSWLHRRQVYF